METEAMEKCMAEPIHPLIKGKSQAVATPKLLGLMKSTMQYHHPVPANFQQLTPTMLSTLPTLARDLLKMLLSFWRMLLSSR